MRFSVIVPIYKVENYLMDCIKSVTAQRFEDLEVILVDDGSPDNCPLICDQLSNQDSRIQVIHKENGGPSSARNAGINAARGEYVVFLDGDDELHYNTLERLSLLLDNESNPDLAIVNFSHCYNNEERVVVDNAEYLGKQNGSLPDLCEAYARNDVEVPWRAYQSIIRRSVFLDTGLRFNEEFAAAEDCDFFFRLIHHIDTYVLSDLCLVKYRAFRSGSLINTQKFQTVYSQLNVFAAMAWDNTGFQDKRLMLRYFSDRFTNIIILVNLLPDSADREKCYEFIAGNKKLIQCTSKKSKYLLARIIWKLFGFEKGSDILLRLKEVRNRQNGKIE